MLTRRGAAYDAQAHAAVCRTSYGGFIVGNRFVLAVTTRRHLVGYAVFLKILQHALGAPLREAQVVLLPAAAVGVPRDFDHQLRISLQSGDSGAQGVGRIGQ
jgi:hypothetical protein